MEITTLTRGENWNEHNFNAKIEFFCSNPYPQTFSERSIVFAEGSSRIDNTDSPYKYEFKELWNFILEYTVNIDTTLHRLSVGEERARLAKQMKERWDFFNKKYTEGLTFDEHEVNYQKFIYAFMLCSENVPAEQFIIV